jgi:phage gp36-like protein
MPVYATMTDLTRLGIPSAALTGVATAAQEAALAAASSLADGYIGAQFVLPLTAWGDDLRAHVAAIAAWTVLKTRGFNPESNADATVRASYEDAIRWLERVAAGTVSPVVTDATPDEDDAGPFVVAYEKRGW